jgi:SAM-dependent methyltransferase
MSLYGGLNTVYRALPEPARRWVNERAPLPVRRLRRRVVSRLERTAKPDELYNRHYYEQVVDPIMVGSAEAMAASIHRELQPRSLIDVGCGTGALMLSLERLGVRCTGFDQASAALEHCRGRGLSVRRLDIVHDPLPHERADVAVSTEVAEHLPESAAERFVELLASLAPVVVMSAALPGTGGKDHVNEQPSEYWIAKFAARGFEHDRSLSTRLRGEWRDAGVDAIYFKSLLIFRAIAPRSES